MGQFDSTKKFLSCQFKNNIAVWVQVGTLILHIIWCYIFIKLLNWREVGAAIAMNLTYILNMVIADILIKARSNGTFKDMVFSYDQTCYQQLGTYLRIGVPGMLMLCFEWWCFELLAIFAGLLNVNMLATEVIIVNCISFLFMLPLGVGYSASALAGNYLGEGKIDLAKRFSNLCILFNVIITTFICILIGVF